MSEHRTFSNEELTAYLDGEADVHLVQEIDDALAVDSGLVDQLQNISIDVQAIKGTFDAVLAESPAAPPVLRAEVADKSGGKWLGLRAAAGIALVCLSVGGYLGTAFQKADETWQGYAAAYHSLYVTNTLSEVRQPLNVSKHDLSRASDLLGKSINFDVVSGVQGLEYKRAQVLGFEGRPLVQIAFMTQQGAPVALCVYPKTHDAIQPMSQQRMLGMSSATWSRDGFEYLLVGSTDDTLIERAANALKELL